MTLPIKLISTDFDGTVHSDLEHPPVPLALQALVGGLQSRGTVWIINTGRDLPSLTDSLRAARLSIQPDYVVTVEREIYARHNSQYLPFTDWNKGCTQAHRDLFNAIEPILPKALAWIQERFNATIYEDAYSPFCLIAQSPEQADAIHAQLDLFFQNIPDLAVVRNGIYARFGHRAYNKGSALAEIARRLEISAQHIFAAGDHLNDLPMLSTEYARCLTAPDNAIDAVKEVVREQNGYVSGEPYGFGVVRGLEHFLKLAEEVSGSLAAS